MLYYRNSIPELLIASHIIPWARDDKNRMNPANGLCLNALHDKAFDKGLITITPDFVVRISDRFLGVLTKTKLEGFFFHITVKKFHYRISSYRKENSLNTIIQQFIIYIIDP